MFKSLLQMMLFPKSHHLTMMVDTVLTMRQGNVF